jgi:hypothetical protein
MMFVKNKECETSAQETLTKPSLLKETIRNVLRFKSLSITFLKKYVSYIFALHRIYLIRSNKTVMSLIKTADSRSVVPQMM